MEHVAIYKEYYEEGWSSFLLLSVPIEMKESHGMVNLVLGFDYRGSYTHGSQCSGRTSKEE